MGGTEPAPVPGPGGAPLVDSSGKPLRSSQDSARLRSLAAAAEGRYLDGSDPKTPAALLAELAPSRRAGPKLEYQSVDRTGLFSALCLLFLTAALAAEILASRGGRG
jgi:hypothetical protein